MAGLTEGRYKDLPAVILESDTVRAVLLPEAGAKLASLVWKPLERELLWQNPAPTFRKSAYGEAFTDGEFAGCDEMFPTISRCYYERPPWQGVELPDHGEVWALPWECSLTQAEARLSVRGVRLPYLLEKRVSLEGSRLQQRYRAVNPAPAPMDFIWAAHPLFNASEGMRFIVPPGMRRIVNSVPGERLGAYGASYTFPTAELPGGPFDLGRVPAKNETGYQKYFFQGPVSEGWCRLAEARSGLTIELSFPPLAVPYLGMWLNEGGYAGQYNIAPEPCTGAMDRVDFARMWGMASVLEAGESREWFLAIDIQVTL
jgi:galactose mutarotase-like enzyme